MPLLEVIVTKKTAPWVTSHRGGLRQSAWARP
jgi:hypothetical protein